MLVYRAQVEEGAELLSVTVRACRTQDTVMPAGGRGLQRFRVTVRCVLPGGAVRTHRGLLMADLPPGRGLLLAGYQVADGEALISFRTAPQPAQALQGVRLARGQAVSDRFRLPIGLVAWGVTAVAGLEVSVHAACRRVGQALGLRGVVRLQILTPGAPFRMRIPFWRQVAPEVGSGLAWRAAAGVTGLHVRVEPGGRLEGELVVAVRCEGRPATGGVVGAGSGAGGPAAAGSGGVPAGEFAAVREVLGHVSSLSAESAGAGTAVVRGSLQFDVYWTDRGGRSRWTGRSLPFSALVDIPGLGAGDRLEPAATIARLAHRLEGGQPRLAALLTLRVTALRPEAVLLGTGQYQMERIAGRGESTVPLDGPLWEELPGPAAQQTGGEVVEASLPLPGPAGGWQELAAVLMTPRARAGRWEVKAALGGTPAGEAPYPQPLRAATGGTARSGENTGLSVVAGLSAVDAGGIRLKAHLSWGPPIEEGPNPEASHSGAPHSGSKAPGPLATHGELELPGPARAVAGLRAEITPAGIDISALIALEHGQLICLRGRLQSNLLPQQACIARITAHPFLQNGRWLLQIAAEPALA